ncbi:hypothetical protein I0P70_02715 [Pontibacter sp. FD36]|uniref:hypothetical protein n=1 Tax=Pontibacter sp. FD36 TaxID=2789860 RepID=UPI0018A938C6|nr:hypothetical protein [Pontibacter sp. FD36]MBF8962146.1 hypothetical protein [Pontibacter sp. FD36]
MPKFSEEEVEKYLDDFFHSLPDNQKYQQREVGAVYFALLDDQFRQEIAEQMEDVKQILKQAEEFITLKIQGNKI